MRVGTCRAGHEWGEVIGGVIAIRSEAKYVNGKWFLSMCLAEAKKPRFHEIM